MEVVPRLVYLLCFGASSACMVLLIRGYVRSRTKLLLYSALCFVGLALNNLLVFVDLVLLPTLDLSMLRAGVICASLAVLLYGFVWEVDGGSR